MGKLLPMVGFATLALIGGNSNAQTSNQKNININIKKELIDNFNHQEKNQTNKDSIDKTNKTHKQIINTPADSLSLEIIRKHMMEELNYIRDSLGIKGQVILNNNINKCVQEYAEYMSKNNHFSHNDKQGNDFTQRLNKYGFNGNNMNGARENLGMNQKTINEIMQKWLNKSEGHREALLRNGLTDIGIGYYKGYWVINLIEKRK